MNLAPSPAEMTPLSERTSYLQALRVGFAIIVLASSLLATNIVGAEVGRLLLPTAAYLAVAASLELARGWSRRLMFVGLMLLIDGVYLAWAMYQTGGTQSPLRFLLYIHLIAVTLLASYRTGLKIALWHSLLFFVIFYAQAADILTPTDEALGLIPGSPEFNRLSVFNVLAFWLVAIGTASFSSLNERELRRRKGDLEDLARMSAALKEEAKPETVAHILLDAVGESFTFHRGIVALREGEHTRTLAYRGPNEPAELLEGTDELLLRACRDQKAILIAKPDESANPGLATLMPFARNLLIVPLLTDGDALGVLVVERPPKLGSKIERRVVSMVEQFASHGALALRNSLLMKEVQTLADTDALTGLANRRTFTKTLEREISRSSRTDKPLTLIILDVDHFKKFNDTYGHQAGDDVLREVGKQLAEASREFDVPARYGGEEFAVILPECSSRESLVVAERLRRKIGAIVAGAPVTASAGVATYPTHASDLEALIRAADEALYESKRDGRNRLTRSSRHPNSNQQAGESA